MPQDHVEYLKWLTKEQKRTQKDIAKEIGVASKSTIARYLSEEREIPPDICNKIEELAKAKKHAFPVAESIYDISSIKHIKKKFWTPGVFNLEYYYVFQPTIDMRCYNSRNLMVHHMFEELFHNSFATNQAEAWEILKPIMEVHYRVSWEKEVEQEEAKKAGDEEKWKEILYFLIDYDPEFLCRQDVLGMIFRKRWPNYRDRSHTDRVDAICYYNEHIDHFQMFHI